MSPPQRWLMAHGPFSGAEPVRRAQGKLLRVYGGFAGGVVDVSEKDTAVAAPGAADGFVSAFGTLWIAGARGFVGARVVFPRGLR